MKLTDADLKDLIATSGILGLAGGTVKQLAKELLSLREKERWIPVSEKLPETYTLVLGYYGARFCGWVKGDGKWYCQDSSDAIDEDVTHWKPLPEAPTQTD